MRTTELREMPFGASVLAGGGVRFRLYAPSAAHVAVLYETGVTTQRVALTRDAHGFHEAVRADAGPGTRYRFDIDGFVAPDPASRFQPDGVHGSSLVVDPAGFVWPDDGWRGRPWNEHVFYELHVGTFTPEGTYARAESRLDYLADLGVTAIELMPLADVPGTRNWGYDGVLLYAPSHNYGSPAELKSFIAAAHARKVAVYLDVVYNHFGPEGNYLHSYAPEFYTDRHHTPWGAALDVATDERRDVRDFFIENAIYWLEEYRFDGLRFDAVHAIHDGPERIFLRELARAVYARVERPVHLILENDDNESSLLGERGYRAQWNDDAHHAAHVAVTGQSDGYYGDYARDTIALLGKTLTQGFAYQGNPSPFRGNRLRGQPSSGLPLGSFVTFLQNHDQVGNRPFGERITALAPDYAVRAILAVLLLAPPPPLLFMGEEWGATTPFLFFCDFEPELASKITAGRRAEFAGFSGFADAESRERIPDPASPATFAASTLRWTELAEEPHRAWHAYYKRLLALRRYEIAPRIATTSGKDAHYETIGTRGLRARFRLDDGTTLTLEANLAADAAPGFSTHPKGFVLFATHDPTFPGTIAPPWSVRWTLA